MRFQVVFAVCMFAFTLIYASVAHAQNSGPLRLEITEGVIEPLPFAAPTFVAGSAETQAYAQEITQVVRSDLTGTGLFHYSFR